MRNLKFKDNKGMTFVEIILVLSVFSLLTLAVYNLANNVTATTNANTEADKLNVVIEKIERAIDSHGTFEEINIDVFNQLSEHHNSAFNFLGVTTQVNTLSINYENINGRACTKFAQKMLSKNSNVQMRVNNLGLVPFADPIAITEACNLENNTVSVILNNNSLATTTTISTVTPGAFVPAAQRAPAIPTFTKNTTTLPTYVGGTSSNIPRTNSGVNYK